MLQRYMQWMLGSVDGMLTLTGAGSKILKDPPTK